MVYYIPVSQNRKFPEPDSDPEVEQALSEPVVDIVYTVFQENGGAKSFAVKVSIRLPVNP